MALSAPNSHRFPSCKRVTGVLKYQERMFLVVKINSLAKDATIMITYQYVKEFGFDQQKIRDRLRICELSEKDKPISEQFQSMVIAPNLVNILDTFYRFLTSHKEFRFFIENAQKLSALRRAQTHYLRTLGLVFTDPTYFDVRLRVGVAHNRIGMPLVLYELAYGKMHEILMHFIPHEIDNHLYQELCRFCGRIITLDMSLAIDSYFASNVHDMKSIIHRLEDSRKKLSVAAETDPLTHVANRNGILNAIYAAIDYARKMGRPLVFAMLDIDRLRDVNDKFGHLVADYVIKDVIKRVQQTLPPMCEIGRYGGDEFIVLFPNHDSNEAKLAAEHIRAAISNNPVVVGKKTIAVSLSQGLTVVNSGDELANVFGNLDVALRDAKNQGGNRIKVR